MIMMRRGNDVKNNLFIKSEEDAIERMMIDGINQRRNQGSEPSAEELMNIRAMLRQNYQDTHNHFLLMQYGHDNGKATAAKQLLDIFKSSSGGNLKVKGQKKKTLKHPVSQYKAVLGKRMKIYKKPDSRKEYVKYKGELVSLVEYKNLMK